MNTSTLLLALVSLVSAPVIADQVVQTFPGGDGKDLLENPRSGDNDGGAIIRDEECAKKFKNSQPDYARCVHDKLEKQRKRGEH